MPTGSPITAEALFPFVLWFPPLSACKISSPKCQENASRSNCYSLLYYLNGTCRLNNASHCAASSVKHNVVPLIPNLLITAHANRRSGAHQIFCKREGERIRECRQTACTGVLHFFGGGGRVAADMELAEEAGIVWIRDFTLRGLPMCNSFWRP